MHRTTCTSKRYLNSNVSSAEVEKLWSKVRKLHLKYDTKKCCLIINFNNITIKNFGPSKDTSKRMKLPGTE